jgi:P4 family phage/plasmid primase-like protien
VTDAVTDYGTELGVFPADLLAQDRWFVWAYDEGRKIPRAPWVNGCGVEKWQSWKDPEVWTDFETADDWVTKIGRLNHASCIPPRERNSEKRVVFLDFDNCRDPESGAIHPTAWGMVVGEEREPMHGAISTSGTGVHGYCWASIPEGHKPSFEIELDDWQHSDDFDEPPSMEVYAADRFLGLTGEHITATPVGLPDLTDTVHDMFGRFGTEQTVSTQREPDVSRAEVQSMDRTTDVNDIYDAISHTRPSDIRLRSTVTEERADSLSMDPSWETSESGTRLAQFDDHWLYRKGNHRLDALQVVALEERIITDPSDYPSGDDFVDAVNALRDRGASIPQLKQYDLSGGDAERPSASADGGTVDAEPAESATEPEPDDTGQASDETDDGADGWERVYEMYASADDADERLPARYEAVDLLDEQRHWRNLLENDQLWAFHRDAGLYRPDGESVAREQLVDALREQYRAHELREMCEQLRGRHTVEESDLGGPDGAILTENCVIEVDRDSIETRDPSPEDTFIGRINTPYDSEAECPRWRAFLEESLESGADRNKVQEFVGYTLMHWALPYHKALFLVGPTASGKSTFLDTVRAMLGDEACSSLTPQQMTSERFGAAELHGQWANIRNDIPTSTIQDTGQFKEIVAGDPVKAEEKYADPFMFKPRAKHAFSANQLPETDTDDEAFFRRILLVPFPDTVPKAERDPALDDKLQDELPGILNWALEGLERLMMQGQFTGDRSPGETQRTWSRWGNSVDRFAELCIEEQAGGAIPKADLFSAYINFCEDEGIPKETQHSMTRALKRAGFDDGREYVDGDRQRCILEVDWTGRGEEYFDGGSGTEATGLDV